MSCCRCNRTGRCKNCACSKARRACDSCLPGRLGKCQNVRKSRTCASSGSTSVMNTITTSNPTTTTCLTASVPSSAQESQIMPTLSNSSDAIDVPGIRTVLSQPADNTASLDYGVTTSNPSSSTNTQNVYATDIHVDMNFTWGSSSGPEMFNLINEVYDEIIHWRHNLFLAPHGNVGNSFVQELARLFRAFAEGSSLECVCMKAVTVLQILTLQKPSRTSKTRDHINHLRRRMNMWRDGNLIDILHEGRCIQNHLCNPRKFRDKASQAKTFQKLMSTGKTNRALRMLYILLFLKWSPWS